MSTWKYMGVLKEKMTIMETLEKAMSDDVLGSLFPKTLCRKYRYARQILFNDVVFHAGAVEMKNGFGRVDSWRNILSNKICAMSRMEPKDYADILYIAEDILKGRENRMKHLFKNSPGGQ
jgi:hypothetical protein